MMDAHLKLLAEAGLRLSAAEDALDAGAFTGARDDLDAAEEQLSALRSAWPSMAAGERSVVARTATPLRERMDTARRRLPRASALIVVEPEPGEDDEDDEPPAA